LGWKDGHFHSEHEWILKFIDLNNGLRRRRKKILMTSPRRRRTRRKIRFIEKLEFMVKEICGWGKQGIIYG